MTTPESNRAQSSFLRLPGEIRNRIYRFALVESGRSILVINRPRVRPVGFTVLELPIFRVSHQVRDEAASLFCSEKRFEIVGIQAAMTVFACLGGHLKSLSKLTLVRPTELNNPPAEGDTEKFLEYLSKATGLKELRLEVGKVHRCNIFAGGAAYDWPFLGPLRDWVREQSGLHFEWCVPLVDTRPGMTKAHRERVGYLRLLFGRENEARTYGAVQLFW